MLGFAFCGSFCTMAAALSSMEMLISRGYEIQPIMSDNAYTIDTRFHRASDFVRRVEAVAKREIIHTVAAAEPLGPKSPLEGLIIAPCTGNTLAKLAGGITDTAVTMATKAHLRQDRPTLIALATNDALSSNLSNLGRLITRRSVYLVPMRQDDPVGKPHSLVARMSDIPDCWEAVMRGEQKRPIFI